MESVTDRAAPAMGTSSLLVIDEPSQIGAARRAAVSLGRSHGLGEETVGRLAIVVTEAATNIVRHATRGVIVLRVLHASAKPVIEMLALDKGPGIPDITRALGDGFSTSGTAGQGLGAIRRLASLFHIYSPSAKVSGTAILARVGDSEVRPSRERHAPSLDDRLGVVCVPMRGEVECGDAWCAAIDRDRVTAMIVDGLGHGPDAALAAAVATTKFETLASEPPATMLGTINIAMRGTRGAALSAAVVDEIACTVEFSGVGNVDGRVLTDERTQHLVPQNGIVGTVMPSLRPTAATWDAGARLVMHSDGISARWHVGAYPGLMNAHPSIMAGVIYRDFSRDRDDATILVVSTNPRSS
jgi:anti-sigma regulatory factor (Ser/Thr protein kinase)